jgi:uncharacterized protein (DUF2249 family)
MTDDDRVDTARTPEADRTLDAREIDGEPFGAIVDALEDLPAGETLVLVNSFEPEPLYSVLADRGFDHETERVDDDEVRVYIRHAE